MEGLSTDMQTVDKRGREVNFTSSTEDEDFSELEEDMADGLDLEDEEDEGIIEETE